MTMNPLRAVFQRFSLGVLLVISGVLGCTDLPPESPAKAGGAEHANVGWQAPPDPVSHPRYAKRFRVLRDGEAVLLEVIRPWQGAQSSYRYCLLPHGTPVPEKYRSASIVRVPVTRVVSMSTTYLPALEMLDAVDVLAGVSRRADISSPAIQQRIKENRLVEVGPVTNVNVEVLLDLAPDLVWTYGVTDGDLAHFRHLAQAGTPVVVTADYMEEEPLGRAEWLRFFALFLGKEAEADTLFRGIEQRYLQLSEKARNAPNKPTVMLESSYQGTWYVPGGRSYVARFLADAGADYLWKDDRTQGSLRLNLETVLEHASHADYWLNTGRWKSVDDALAEDPRYWSFQPLQNGNTYNHNAKENELLANDFFESGPARPDLVLADMVKIFHPHLVPDHQFIWYHRLAPPSKEPK